MNLQEIAPLTGIASFVVATLSFAHTQFQVRATLVKDIATLGERIDAIDKRVEAIEDVINELRETLPKVELFWDIIREQVPKMLLHPDDYKRDVLLMKLSNNTIKHDEAIDLKAILENDLEHYKQNREVMQADPLATLVPFALWALEVKLKQTDPTVVVRLVEDGD